jgi:ribosome-associated translation inhibitor RaiA
MSVPITVTLRHLDRSPALTSRAMDMARRLWRYNENIRRCHLTIEGGPSKQDHGHSFIAKIDLEVPGAHIHADSGGASPFNDPYAAIRDAVGDARRQLVQLAQSRDRDRIRRAMSAQAERELLWAEPSAKADEADSQ